jgi:uncharacterized protein (TIGR02145 family)
MALNLTAITTAALLAAAISPAQAANPETVNIKVQITPAINLAISGCSYSTTDPVVKLTISAPNPAGSFSSCSTALTVSTNHPGYELSIQAIDSTSQTTDTPYADGSTSDGGVHLVRVSAENTPPTLPSLDLSNKIAPHTGNITTPTAMDSPTTSVWGFAIPNTETGSISTGFDTSYATMTSVTDTAVSIIGNYAAVPATNTNIRETTQTAEGQVTNVFFGTRVKAIQAAGIYRATAIFTLVGNMIPCEWDSSISYDDVGCKEPDMACSSGPAFKGNIGNIQDAAVSTASWAVGDTGIATDVRDNQNYCIGKLADDNIWMLNNLKLGSTTSTTALTPTDTNIQSNWALPQVSTSSSYSYDSPYAYGPVPGDTSGDAGSTTSNSAITTDTFYGYIYNWCAATGGIPSATSGQVGYTCTAGGTSPEDSKQDICPVNWRLPTGGSSGEFAWLNAKMNNPSATSPSTSTGTGYYQNWQFTGPFKGVFAGGRYGSSWGGQGDDGVFWSSSHYPDGPAFASVLGFGSGVVYPGYWVDRDGGFSVRCLLR